MAGETLTVACRVPNGLVLQVFGSEDWQEPLMGGGYKPVQRAFVRHDMGRVTLNGPARKIGADTPYEIRHGVGLTHGVDAALFNAWLEQNKDSDIVKKGLVFASPKPRDVVAQAKERRGEKSGMEPIDPNNLPPEFQRRTSRITTADVT
jgi:hypothetical protein